MTGARLRDSFEIALGNEIEEGTALVAASVDDQSVADLYNELGSLGSLSGSETYGVMDDNPFSHGQFAN